VVASDGTTIASRVSYDPWGKIAETGSGAVTDLAFTGHHFDRPTGLALAWYRGYDPVLGRWLSKDPIGLGGGPNLYGYVKNDPLNEIDPDGRLSWPLVCAFVGVAAQQACLNSFPGEYNMCFAAGQAAEALCNARPPNPPDAPPKPPPTKPPPRDPKKCN
jgi:RHS repeat-associated protein